MNRNDQNVPSSLFRVIDRKTRKVMTYMDGKNEHFAVFDYKPTAKKVRNALIASGHDVCVSKGSYHRNYSATIKPGMLKKRTKQKNPSLIS